MNTSSNTSEQPTTLSAQLRAARSAVRAHTVKALRDAEENPRDLRALQMIAAGRGTALSFRHRRMAVRLISKGWVALSHEGPLLTPAGTQELDRLRTIRDDALRSVLSSLSDEQQEALRSGLDALAATAPQDEERTPRAPRHHGPRHGHAHRHDKLSGWKRAFAYATQASRQDSGPLERPPHGDGVHGHPRHRDESDFGPRHDGCRPSAPERGANPQDASEPVGASDHATPGSHACECGDAKTHNAPSMGRGFRGHGFEGARAMKIAYAHGFAAAHRDGHTH